MTSVPKHTWWIDSGATTHISVSMQGFLSCRKPNDCGRYIFVSDGKKVEVEAIRTFRLLLKSGTYLDLNETYVVTSFQRNLVSISIFDKFGYTCSFGNNKFSLFQNSQLLSIEDKTNYAIDESGGLLYKSILCVPNVMDLRKKILYESHNTVFTMHLGSNKMY